MSVDRRSAFVSKIVQIIFVTIAASVPLSASLASGPQGLPSVTLSPGFTFFGGNLGRVIVFNAGQTPLSGATLLVVDPNGATTVSDSLPVVQPGTGSVVQFSLSTSGGTVSITLPSGTNPCNVLPVLSIAETSPTGPTVIVNQFPEHTFGFTGVNDEWIQCIPRRLGLGSKNGASASLTTGPLDVTSATSLSGTFASLALSNPANTANSYTINVVAVDSGQVTSQKSVTVGGSATLITTLVLPSGPFLTVVCTNGTPVLLNLNLVQSALVGGQTQTTSEQHPEFDFTQSPRSFEDFYHCP